MPQNSSKNSTALKGATNVVMVMGTVEHLLSVMNENLKGIRLARPQMYTYTWLRRIDQRSVLLAGSWRLITQGILKF